MVRQFGRRFIVGERGQFRLGGRLMATVYLINETHEFLGPTSIYSYGIFTPLSLKKNIISTSPLVNIFP